MRAIALSILALSMNPAFAESEVSGPYQKAIESIQKGDQEALKRAIVESGLSPNVRVCASKPGKTSCTTLIHQAIRYGQAGALKTLAAMPGLNPNLVELTERTDARKEESAVILALKMGRTDIAETLIGLPAFDPKQTSTSTEYGLGGVRTSKEDVLSAAKKSGHEKAVKQMLKAHEDARSLDEAARTALNQLEFQSDAL